MRYENENDFHKYVNELSEAIKQGTWKEYMESNDFPIVYHYHNIDVYREYKIQNDQYDEDLTLSEPHYCEVGIDAIKGFYNDGGRKGLVQATLETRRKNYRVIFAIESIMNNKCLPIPVIKFNDGYYITNGRHRFFAHLILRKEMVPVWMSEIIPESMETDGDMITISKPYDVDFAIPEDALAFYNRYSMLFESISSVEMAIIDNRYKLLFNLENGDTVSFNGCCTSGNHFRSSYVTCELLQKCGFLVDMNYISLHDTFYLENKNDAHNMDFSIEIDEKFVLESIVPLLADKKTDSIREINQGNDDILMTLYNYITLYFNEMNKWSKGQVCGLDSNSSYLLSVGNKYFYIVSVCFLQKDEKMRIFIFEDNNYPFNNLSIKFLGSIDESHDLYNLF